MSNLVASLLAQSRYPQSPLHEASSHVAPSDLCPNVLEEKKTLPHAQRASQLPRTPTCIRPLAWLGPFSPVRLRPFSLSANLSPHMHKASSCLLINPVIIPTCPLSAPAFSRSLPLEPYPLGSSPRTYCCANVLSQLFSSLCSLQTSQKANGQDFALHVKGSHLEAIRRKAIAIQRVRHFEK